MPPTCQTVVALGVCPPRNVLSDGRWRSRSSLAGVVARRDERRHHQIAACILHGESEHEGSVRIGWHASPDAADLPSCRDRALDRVRFARGAVAGCLSPRGRGRKFWRDRVELGIAAASPGWGITSLGEGPRRTLVLPGRRPMHHHDANSSVIDLHPSPITWAIEARAVLRTMALDSTVGEGKDVQRRPRKAPVACAGVREYPLTSLPVDPSRLQSPEGSVVCPVA